MSLADDIRPRSSSHGLARRRFLASGAALLTGAPLGALAASDCGTADAAAAADPGPTVRPAPLQHAAREALAALSDVKLWYWDTGGAGEPIVLLHPFTGSARVWTFQQPAFAAAGYRVIGYSRRGFQNSERGPAERPGTGAEDLHGLLEALGIGRFHAVASAGGAFVAADYAFSHPDRLLSLTIACSILGIQDPELSSLMSGLHTPDFDKLPAYMRELGPSYRAIDPQGTQRWRELQASSMPGEPLQQPFANALTLRALEQLTPPVLMICGDADLIAPPPVMRRLAQHTAHSELHILPECGHSAYWERPDLFNATVLKFLQRVG